MKSLSKTERGFTLVELLVVVAIMAVLMGLAIPAFQGIGRGSRVNTAVFQLNSTINLARQMAITTRQKVYILFPHYELPYYSNTISLAYSAYAVYAENDGYVGDWRFLPAGVVFHDYFNPPGATAANPRNIFLQRDPYKVTVPFPRENDPPRDLLALTFRPDGALDIAGSSRKGAFVVEGWVDFDPVTFASSSIAPTNRQDARVFGVELNPITGQSRQRNYPL